MTKHARKSPRLQAVERPKTAPIDVPLPVLSAFARIERSYFDLCIRAGQQVLDAMMEQDRTVLCGPRGKRDPARRAGRAGTTSSEVTLGGRRIRLTRPRVRSQAGHELELPSFAFAAHRDPLDAQTVNAVACGKYARSRDTLSDEVTERSTSKSAVSRRYVALTTKQLTAWLTTPLGDRHFPIVLIDGIILGDHTVLIALGIDGAGNKQMLGLREGHTEHSRVVKALLRDLVDRGLDPDRARLFVIDGAKALSSAIRTVFGSLAVIQRCQLQTPRNILGRRPERLHANVMSVLHDAWHTSDARPRSTPTIPGRRPPCAKDSTTPSPCNASASTACCTRSCAARTPSRTSTARSRPTLEECEAVARRHDGRPLGQRRHRRSGKEVPTGPWMARHREPGDRAQ